jgi:O-antigen/teichoic acid export membrane protein
MIEKLKELTKDTAVYGISTIVGRFLGFLLVPVYTNVFTTGEFGIYSNIYAYLAFLNIVYIYGMDAAFLKYSSTASTGAKKDTFSTPYVFVAITSIVFSFLMFLLRDPLSVGMQIGEGYKQLINYVLLILLFDTFAVVPFANLRLNRKSKKFALIKLGNICINLGMNLVLIFIYHYGIEAIFISNLIASIFSFLALLPEIFRNLRVKINITILKRMLRFGIPYLPASMAAMLVQMVDRPIVLALTNESTLGIYQANYKLGIFMMLFVAMFQYAWQPFFLNNAKEKNAKEIFSKVLTGFLLVASSIWIILTLFVENFAEIEIYGRTIIGSEFLSGIYIVPIILFAYIFNGMYYNFQAGIYIEEKTKYFPYVTGAGALINVVVNLLIIPVLGIYGASLATLASYLIMAIGSFAVSQRFYKINYEYGKILKILGTIVVIGLAYYYLIDINLLNLLSKFILLVVFCLSLIILRVISKEEIKTLIKILLKKA